MRIAHDVTRPPDRSATKYPTYVLLLAVIKCIYLPPTYIHFTQDIEDRCLLLMSSTSFVNLTFQEHHMDKIHAYLQYVQNKA
jgi:hypothetical protein